MTGPNPRRWLWPGLASAAVALTTGGVVVLIVVLVSGSAPRARPSPSGTGRSISVASAAPTASSTTPAPTPRTPALPAPAGEQLGAGVNGLFNGRHYGADLIDAELAALRRTGATIAHSDSLWELIEPQPPVNGAHHYDWRFDDSIAGSLAAHGLRWLPILDYSASWARASPGRLHSPPATPTDYAAYAAAFVARYGPGGAFWSSHPSLTPEPVATVEIWNEPDDPSFWSPTPDASRYAELYLSARSAISAVDDRMGVIVGGLTKPTTFLAAMLAARPELRNQIDGVAIHPYAPGPLGVLAGVRAARLALGTLGLSSLPLYVTEFGWTTRPPGALHYAPERLRPSYISSTVAALGHLDCGLAAGVLYTWMTAERDPGNAQDWFGISSPQPAATPDTIAFATGIAKARAPGAQNSLCGGG